MSRQNKPGCSFQDDVTLVETQLPKNVLLQGFEGQFVCILTQMPLSETIFDFWRLVRDYNCSTVVMLNQASVESTNLTGKEPAIYFVPTPENARTF